MVTPNSRSNALCTSTGSAEPPAAATRRLSLIFATSTVPPASFSAPSSPQYMVGTPAKKVMPSLCISSSAAPASKRGSITTVPPYAAEPFWITVCPKEWNSGSTHRNVSGCSASAPNCSSPSSALSRMLRCRSSAPLGCPVVPEV